MLNATENNTTSGLGFAVDNDVDSTNSMVYTAGSLLSKVSRCAKQRKLYRAVGISQVGVSGMVGIDLHNPVALIHTLMEFSTGNILES